MDTTDNVKLFDVVIEKLLLNPILAPFGEDKLAPVFYDNMTSQLSMIVQGHLPYGVTAYKDDFTNRLSSVIALSPSAITNFRALDERLHALCKQHFPAETELLEWQSTVSSDSGHLKNVHISVSNGDIDAYVGKMDANGNMSFDENIKPRQLPDAFPRNTPIITVLLCRGISVSKKRRALGTRWVCVQILKDLNPASHVRTGRFRRQTKPLSPGDLLGMHTNETASMDTTHGS
eukprot:Nk52_evm3s315 gene=Nk52_evmTU3s315